MDINDATRAMEYDSTDEQGLLGERLSFAISFVNYISNLARNLHG